MINDRLLDIKGVGLLKQNTKYLFPSDNSVIMSVKNQTCGKRMGES
jgi:hypothetical protein